MSKTWLTKNGNVLLLDAKGHYSFHTPELVFIRECSQSEGNWIVSNNPTQVDIHCKLHSEFAEYCAGTKKFPTWHFIKSIKVIEDDSNYRWETSNNGGNYSFSERHNWYCAKINGEWKFAFTVSHHTSAEFSFDELNGTFQSGLQTLTLYNTEECDYFWTQSGTIEEVLEKLATMSSFEHMWNSQFEHIPSQWDETDEAYTSPALTFSDKKGIVTRLREIGVTKEQVRRPQRRTQQYNRR